jgi:hypothetical protein
MVSLKPPEKASTDFLKGTPKVNIPSVYAEFLDAYQKANSKALSILREKLRNTNITPEEHVTHVVAILFAQDSICRAEVLKEIAAYAVREGVDTHFFSEVDRHEHVQGVLQNEWYDQKGLFLTWLSTPEGKKVMEPLIADLLQKTIDAEVKELNKKMNDMVKTNHASLMEIYVKNKVSDLAGEQLQELREKVDKAFEDLNDLALIAPEKKALVQKKSEENSFAFLVMTGFLMGLVLVGIVYMLMTHGLI